MMVIMCLSLTFCLGFYLIGLSEDSGIPDSEDLRDPLEKIKQVNVMLYVQSGKKSLLALAGLSLKPFNFANICFLMRSKDLLERPS